MENEPVLTTITSALRVDCCRFEFWESNVAGRLGLGVAMRYAMDIGMGSIEGRIRHLAGSLRELLESEPGVSLMDLGRTEHQCGIVSFVVKGVDAGHVKQGLRSQGVFVSTSSAGSTPLDAENRALPTVVRIRSGVLFSDRMNHNALYWPAQRIL